jgi:hypothetical protein
VLLLVYFILAFPVSVYHIPRGFEIMQIELFYLPILLF